MTPFKKIAAAVASSPSTPTQTKKQPFSVEDFPKNIALLSGTVQGDLMVARDMLYAEMARIFDEYKTETKTLYTISEVEDMFLWMPFSEVINGKPFIQSII